MNISQIEVFIHPSIPNFKEPVKLTKDTITHPSIKGLGDLSEFPYITNTIRYPVYQLKRLNDYSKIIKFFFNLKYFKEKLTPLISKNKTSLTTSETNSILKSNVMSMLELLFPTSFPNKKNLYSSYEAYILQKYDTDFSFSLKNPFFANYEFSYLSMNSKTYTVSKVVWLNDVYNNPVYKQFIGDFSNFQDKIVDENKRIDEIMKQKWESLYKYLETDAFLWKEKNIKELIFSNAVWFPKDNNLYIDTDTANLIRENKPKKIEEFFKKYFDNLTLVEILEKAADLEKSMYGSEIDERRYRDSSSSSSSKREFFAKYLNFLTTMLQIGSIKRPINGVTNPDIDPIYDMIVKTNEVFDSIPNVPQKSKQSYRRIASDIKEIYTYSVIKSKYLAQNQLNINIKDEEEFIVNKLKSEFKIFINFIENIKKILPGQKVSTNEDLQRLINDYAVQTYKSKSCGFDDVMLYIYNNFVKKASSTKSPENCSNILSEKYFYTGLTKINMNDFDKPQYEVHIHVNLIEGVLNNENISKFFCNYKGLYLGKELEHIVVNYNKYDVLEDSLFFSLEKDVMDSKKKEPPRKQGGKRKRSRTTLKKRSRYYSKRTTNRRRLR